MIGKFTLRMLVRMDSGNYTPCEEYGCDMQIVDPEAPSLVYRCTDCGIEYED